MKDPMEGGTFDREICGKFSDLVTIAISRCRLRLEGGHSAVVQTAFRFLGMRE
jgi:hypothetical protein